MQEYASNYNNCHFKYSNLIVFQLNFVGEHFQMNQRIRLKWEMHLHPCVAHLMPSDSRDISNCQLIVPPFIRVVSALVFSIPRKYSISDSNGGRFGFDMMNSF